LSDQSNRALNKATAEKFWDRVHHWFGKLAQAEDPAYTRAKTQDYHQTYDLLERLTQEKDAAYPQAESHHLHHQVEHIASTDEFWDGVERKRELFELERALVQTKEPVTASRQAPHGPFNRSPKPLRLLLSIGSVLLVVLLVAVVVVRLVLAPPTPQEHSADGVLSFGTLLPESGSLAVQGPAEIAGVQLALKDIKSVIKDIRDAGGGAFPMAVELYPLNQRNSGDTSTNIAHESTNALLSNGVDVIIGAGSSQVSLTVIDKITSAGVIMLSSDNTSTVFATYNDQGRYFRTSPSDILQGKALGQLLAKDNHSAVIMAIDDPYGNSLSEATAKAFKDNGGNVLDELSYDPEATNYDQQIKKIKALNPDAIVLIGLQESPRVLTAMIQQGIGPRNKHVYGTDGNMSPRLASRVNPQSPEVLDGMKGTTLATGDEAFLTRLREIDPVHDPTYAAQSYDAVVITALAAAIANTDAPSAIANEINNVTRGGVKCMTFADCMKLLQEHKDIDYDGVSGPLEFTDAGEPRSATYVINQIQADGSLTPLHHEPASF
jgi:ABC-type branched-subunit amino acid transport system substrate-binding protein